MLVTIAHILLFFDHLSVFWGAKTVVVSQPSQFLYLKHSRLLGVHVDGCNGCVNA